MTPKFFRRFISLAVLAQIISSCPSGDSIAPPDYVNQTLVWESCDSTLYQDLDAQQVAALGKRLTCTRMQAPLDYSNPQKGMLTIALSKISAEKSSERKGAIFF
jgi:hypothetical protein